MEVAIKQENHKARHPEVGFEPGDLGPGHVFGFLISLFCGLLVVHVVLWGVFHHFGKAQYAGHQTTNPIMTSNEELNEIGGDPALVFAKPTVQPDPIADLNKFRASEEEEMTTYGWVDPSQGRVRIPVERAIDALAASWPNQHDSDQGPAVAVSATELRRAYQGKGR